MLKKGQYAICNQKEYKIGRVGDDWVTIVSKDLKDLNKGFQPHPLDSTVLIKRIPRAEIQEVYQITTYALYKGYKLGVGSQKDGKLLIGIGDAELANLLGLERTDKYFYEKWVPLEDVQLIEEKKPSIL